MELNAKMTDASQGENSLAQLALNIQMAQADLATRDLLLQSALQSGRTDPHGSQPSGAVSDNFGAAGAIGRSELSPRL